jgi:hypothetical protein
MEVSGQIHAPAAFIPVKKPQSPTDYGAGWAPEETSKIWRTKNKYGCRK